MCDHNIKKFNKRVLSGEDFNSLFPILSRDLVKLTNKEEIHNGFKFKTGENKDTIKFNTYGSCRAGGIYITDIRNLPRWTRYKISQDDESKDMEFYRAVKLPEDCKIFILEDKFKADKIILGERVKISDLELWSEYSYCMDAVYMNSSNIKYFRNFHKDIQYAASRFEGWIKILLENKIVPSEDVQQNAVQNDGTAIEFLLEYDINVSEKVLELAASTSKNLIRKLIEKNILISRNVELIAARKFRDTIKILLENGIPVSNEIQLAAASHFTGIINVLLDKGVDISNNYQLQLTAVKIDAFAMDKLFDHKIMVIDDVLIEAINAREQKIYLLLEKKIPISKNVQLAVVRKNCFVLNRLLESDFICVSEEVKMEAIRENGNVIRYLMKSTEDIKNISEDMLLAAVSQENNSNIVKYMIEIGVIFSKKMQIAIVTHNPNSVFHLLYAGIVIDEEVQLATVRNRRRLSALHYLLQSPLNKNITVSDNVIRTALEYDSTLMYCTPNPCERLRSIAESMGCATKFRGKS